jgi:hypothetical protein
MKTTDSTQALSWQQKSAAEVRKETGVTPFVDTLLMLPAGIIGLIIGAFPLSLPLLYMIALCFVE